MKSENSTTIKRYKHYLSCKPSGVEWLGDVPEHWEVCKIRRLSIVKRRASPRPIDDPKYFDDEGEYSWVRISDVTASGKYLERTTQKLSELGNSLSVKLEPGSFFVSIAGSVGKPVITRIKCCIHDGFVYLPNLKLNPDLLYYLFESGYLFQGLGKLGTQLNLNTDTIGSIKIPLPPPDEIVAIAHFLDRETTRIDTLIAKKRELIDLLEKKRSSIVTEAVTKGCDRNVPVRDSGVAWIGKVLEHWQVLPLKRICLLQRGIDITKDQQLEGEVPVVSSGGIFSYHNVATSKAPGVVIGRKGTLGKVYFLEQDYWAHDTTLYVINFHKNDPKFIYYKLKSMDLENWDTGSANPTLNRNSIHPVKVSLPPLKEQIEIVSFLNSEFQRTDQMIDKIEKHIILFQQYRQALITAAVTGKIDVREEIESDSDRSIETSQGVKR